MLRKKNRIKIFCISMQRTGTTSVGEFFKKNNFKVADWNISNKNKWSYLWENGNFEKIFKSKDFLNNQVFEDDPWWLPEFYKVLYHRFPTAKFILFTRNSDDWFQSMLNHSNGKILGNTKRHCKVYRREQDFYKLMDEDALLNYNENNIDNLLTLKNYDIHYKNIYEIRNLEIVNFFKKHSPDSLFHCELEDNLKWQKLADFIKIKISNDFNVHANKSI